MSDLYRTAAHRATVELKERGSRFIAEAVSVSAPEEALKEIQAVKRREHAAKHHCSAYRIGVDAAFQRFDDDGEPSGTAGQPILRQLVARGLTNTLVIVTRYFGGTKLGTGGLMRAYGAAASLALDEAGEVQREVRTRVRVRFSYDDTATAMLALEQFDGRIIRSKYTDVTTLEVSIRASKAEAFRAAFVEMLAGRGQVNS